MSRDSEVRGLEEIDGAETTWLWHERIPLGHVTVVAGEAASGKSLLAAEIAARASSGEAWPDAPDSDRRPPGQVLVAHSDRHMNAVLKRRLMAAGANPRQVAIVDQGLGAPDGVPSGEALLAHLESALKKVPDCSLVVVDHLRAWLGKINLGPQEQATAFARLADFAARRRIALVVVWRLDKTAPGGPARALDGLLAVAPVVWLLASDPYRGEVYRAVCAQNQLGRLPDNLAFCVEGDRLAWQPPGSQATADEVVAATARSVDRYERRQAGQWLLELLADGPIEAGQLWEEARQCRLSERTVRRAASELGLHPIKVGQRGPWLWGFRGESISRKPMHEDAEAVAGQSACDVAPENVAALETVGSLANSAVLNVELRRDAAPSVATTARIDPTNDLSEAAAQTEEATRQSTGEPSGAVTAADAPASQNVAALETAGSLGTNEAAAQTNPNAEKHRLRKLRREKRRREHEALLEFHNLLRNG